MQVLVATFHKESPTIPIDIVKEYMGIPAKNHTVLEWLYLNLYMNRTPTWSTKQLLKDHREMLDEAYPGQGLWAIAMSFRQANDVVSFFIDPNPKQYGKKAAAIMREAQLQIQANALLFHGAQSRFVL